MRFIKKIYKNRLKVQMKNYWNEVNHVDAQYKRNKMMYQRLKKWTSNFLHYN